MVRCAFGKATTAAVQHLQTQQSNDIDGVCHRTYAHYCSATYNLQHNFPSMLASQLQSADEECAICKEPMKVASPFEPLPSHAARPCCGMQLVSCSLLILRLCSEDTASCLRHQDHVFMSTVSLLHSLQCLYCVAHCHK